MKQWTTSSGTRIVKVLSGRSNVFAVLKEYQFLLIDTSTKRNRGKLFKFIEENAAQGIAFAGLILTHAHFDHAENAAAIQEKYGVPVLIHREDAGYLSSGNNPFFSGTITITRLLMGTVGKRVFRFFRYTPVKDCVSFENGYNLEGFGCPGGWLLHTPGHTPGSSSIIVDNEVAVTGDAMFGVFRNSIFPPFGSDAKTLVKSWGKLLETECTVFLPSHGTEKRRGLVQKEYERYMKKFQLNGKY